MLRLSAFPTWFMNIAELSPCEKNESHNLSQSINLPQSDRAASSRASSVPVPKGMLMGDSKHTPSIIPRLFFIALLVAGSVALLNLTPSSSTPFASATEKDTPSPLAEVTETIESIVDTVEEFPGDSLTKQRREKLREVINPRFDFREMAKRSLGSAWSTAPDGEREEFVHVFSDLLARTYLNHIETVKRGMVKVLSEDITQSSSDESGPKKAIVKTEVTNKGSTFPIVYKLALTDSGWRAYDVVIENIGLVANYRNEFAGVIRKEKLSGLIVKLKEKNSKAAG